MTDAEPVGRLYVCETCDRYGPPGRDGRTRGRQLADAVDAAMGLHGPGLALRVVSCLNGCMNPCNAALRGHAKITYRFGRLNAEDAEALLRFAAAYALDAEGEVDTAPFEGGLADKITVKTRPLRLPDPD